MKMSPFFLPQELHDVRNTKRGELCGADADPTTSPALTVQETRMELEVLRKLLDKTRSQIEQAQLEVRGTLERCRHCTCDAVRTQCDDLRKERDRTVAELTQVLRNSNDIERQMNQILAELKGKMAESSSARRKPNGMPRIVNIFASVLIIHAISTEYLVVKVLSWNVIRF